MIDPKRFDEVRQTGRDEQQDSVCCTTVGRRLMLMLDRSHRGTGKKNG